MPAVIAFLMRALFTAAPGIVVYTLKAIGFGLVTYTGMYYLTDTVKDYIFSNLGNVPAAWMSVLGLLKIDVCVNIIISAHAANLMSRGISKANDKQTSINFLGGDK